MKLLPRRRQLVPRRRELRVQRRERGVPLPSKGAQRRQLALLAGAPLLRRREVWPCGEEGDTAALPPTSATL